jgi:hypothetical protein
MIRPHHLLVLAPAVVALLALSAAPAAASSSEWFTATVSGSGAFTSQNTVVFNGKGTATLMGSVTNSGSIQITGQDSSCSGGLANVNTEVLTAASGDTLTLTSQDVACPTGPGRYQGSGSWRITGGTGRFQGTTGNGSSTGSADFNVGTITNTFTGMLTLAND